MSNHFCCDLAVLAFRYIPTKNSYIYLIGNMNARLFVAEPCTTAKLYKQPNNPQQENGYHNHTVEYSYQNKWLTVMWMTFNNLILN